MNETEEKIIKTFLKLSREKNIESISIRDISKEANLSTGISYRYFQNKKDILIKSFIYSSEELKKNVSIDFSTSYLSEKSFKDIIDYSKDNCSVFYLLMYLEYTSLISKVEFDILKNQYCHIFKNLSEFKDITNLELSYFILLPLFKYCIDLQSKDNLLDKNVFIKRLMKIF